jgi:hypothetical protein
MRRKRAILYDQMLEEDKAGTWDIRLCGRLTKQGKRCRAHATTDSNGWDIEHVGCYLHDPRRCPRSEG